MFVLISYSNTLVAQVLVSKVNSYDAFGNPLEVEDASGAITKYYYGSNDAPFSQIGIDGINGVYLTGIQKVVGTDDCINCSTRPNNGNDLFTEAKYDELGQLEQIIDENEISTSFIYDDFGRLAMIKNHDGQVLSEYTYTYAGDAFSSTNPNKVEAITYVNPLFNSDFSTSVGWSSVHSTHNKFNVPMAGQTTVRMGSGGSWESMNVELGSEEVYAKIDFYPDHTTGGTPHIMLDGAGHRFAVHYKPGNDSFRFSIVKIGGLGNTHIRLH